jgi:hypothetical protein
MTIYNSNVILQTCQISLGNSIHETLPYCVHKLHKHITLKFEVFLISSLTQIH